MLKLAYRLDEVAPGQCASHCVVSMKVPHRDPEDWLVRCRRPRLHEPGFHAARFLGADYIWDEAATVSPILDQVELSRHSEPVRIPPEGESFDHANPVCGHYSIGSDGTEIVCELTQGHEGPCRGVARRG